MPFWTRIRTTPETIVSYEQACEARYLEGADLIERGSANGGFYLQGYVAETALKAAFFRVLGKSTSEPITTVDRLDTGIPTQSQHDPASWMNKLISIRAPRPLDASVEENLRMAIHVIQENWSTALRYRDEEPTPKEKWEFTNAVEWIIMNRVKLV